MASVWLYGCELGLYQGDCNSYEADEGSRGYGKIAGCPSCKFRRADNAETMRADNNYASRVTEDA